MWKTYAIEWGRNGVGIYIDLHYSPYKLFKGRNKKEAERKATKFLRDAEINCVWRVSEVKEGKIIEEK